MLYFIITFLIVFLSTSIPPSSNFIYQRTGNLPALWKEKIYFQVRSQTHMELGTPSSLTYRPSYSSFPEGVSRLTRKLAPNPRPPVPEMVCTVTYWRREVSGQWGAAPPLRAHNLPKLRSSPQRGTHSQTPPFFPWSRGHPSKWDGNKRTALFSFHFLRDR